MPNGCRAHLEPTQMIRDQMPILTSRTLHDYDPLLITPLGEFVAATLATSFDGASESDGELGFDSTDGDRAAAGSDRGQHVVSRVFLGGGLGCGRSELTRQHEIRSSLPWQVDGLTVW